MSTDVIPTSTEWTQNYTIIHESMTNNHKPQTTIYKEPNLSPLQIYTDGSLLDGKAGAGFAIYQQIPDRENPDLIIKSHAYLGEETSVFQAEIYAIFMAITTLQNISVESEENKKLYGSLTNLPVTIFCDSQAAIKTLEFGTYLHGRTTITASVHDQRLRR